MDPTNSAVMGCNFHPQYRPSYQTMPRWFTHASGELRVRDPKRVLHWARVYPPQIRQMMRSMVVCGERTKAEAWAADFEQVFLAVPDNWTGAIRSKIAADAAEDVRRDDLLLDLTPEQEDRYLAALQAEVAHGQRLIRVLEARKAGR